ncbi:MAG: T9SS type A sorting domain-containing protein [Bacteroidia bacterium]
MKKGLQKAILAMFCLGLSFQLQAQRYLTEIFPSANVTPNVVYGNNISILPALAGGQPAAEDLKMDVYEPAGAVDPLTERPLVIIMHTGSFLPPIINGQPTGQRIDSTVVEMCKRFARRGYVAAAMSYRLGWNPQAIGPTGQDIRTGTLLQAVYRAILDAKACVRYFRAEADTGGNSWGIDTSKIILGGIGTGGYIALAYATLDDPAEISLTKFLANSTNATYGFTAGQSYVNQALLGDFEGAGGIPQLNNPNNHQGYNSKVQFVFNMGGAMGDTSWIEAGDAPMVAFHPVGDPFAPYGIGNVIVPTTGQFVVEVGGSHEVLRLANQLGNNNCFANAGFTDQLTTYANTVNDGYEGLYPLYTNPSMQAGPWEWYDSTTTYFIGMNVFGKTQGYMDTLWANTLITNPDMSKAKGMAYIDTIMGYLNPRVVYCLNLTTGINEPVVSASTISIVPNPAADRAVISSSNDQLLRAVVLMDVTGKEVKRYESVDAKSFTLEREGLDAGIYLLSIKTDQGTAVSRLIFR